MRLYRFLAAISIVLLAARGWAADAQIAVASNFHGVAEQLGADFASQGGGEVRFIAGATGKLYAQVLHGAPFDAFLSADAERPDRLEQDGLGVKGSRFTYAYGRLLLWSRDARYRGRDCTADLRAGRFGHLAIANPQTAPFGVAAQETLRALGLTPQSLQGRLVMGENVAQAFQFVATGSADLGLVPRSLAATPVDGETCRWDVPASMHAPIAQQAVLLRRGKPNATARAFLAYLRSPAARARIQSLGYEPGA